MKSEFIMGGTPDIYESPEIQYMGIMTRGILCASPTDYGSYINDAGQEDDIIFENTLEI